MAPVFHFLQTMSLGVAIGGSAERIGHVAGARQPCVVLYRWHRSMRAAACLVIGESTWPIGHRDRSERIEGSVERVEVCVGAVGTSERRRDVAGDEGGIVVRRIEVRVARREPRGDHREPRVARRGLRGRVSGCIPRTRCRGTRRGPRGDRREPRAARRESRGTRRGLRDGKWSRDDRVCEEKSTNFDRMDADRSGSVARVQQQGTAREACVAGSGGPGAAIEVGGARGEVVGDGDDARGAPLSSCGEGEGSFVTIREVAVQVGEVAVQVGEGGDTRREAGGTAVEGSGEAVEGGGRIGEGAGAVAETAGTILEGLSAPQRCNSSRHRVSLCDCETMASSEFSSRRNDGASSMRSGAKSVRRYAKRPRRSSRSTPPSSFYISQFPFGSLLSPFVGPVRTGGRPRPPRQQPNDRRAKRTLRNIPLPSMRHRSILFRQLPPWAAAIASVLIFAVVAGAFEVAAEGTGIERHWAFAIGWIVGFTVITGRSVIHAPGYSRSLRWRAFAYNVGLMLVVTVLVIALWGARIFAPAT